MSLFQIQKIIAHSSLYFLNKEKLNFGIEAQAIKGLVVLGVKNAFCGTEPTFVTEQRNLAIVKPSISFC